MPKSICVSKKCSAFFGVLHGAFAGKVRLCVFLIHLLQYIHPGKYTVVKKFVCQSEVFCVFLYFTDVFPVYFTSFIHA